MSDTMPSVPSAPVTSRPISIEWVGSEHVQEAYEARERREERDAPAFGGKKYDAGKARFWLLPFGALNAIARVMSVGAQKYGPNNWQALDDFEGRYASALMRHLHAWKSGQDRDEETGELHLAHAGCCLLFLLSKQVGFDVR